MFRGDRSRKQTLVDFGFRLPSALDNRPLKFDEFEERVNQVIYMSATPGNYEVEQTGGVVVEQLIRPTGLIDPRVEIRPVGNQVDDLLGEIRTRVATGQRVLITTLTKRMAEDLTEYYQELGVKCRYLHSDIDTLERVQLLDDLRRGTYDVLIGINLLREGLDLPEVGLVAILDADKEGFLRSARSLIQTIGRAARNVDGTVIMYADRVTDSMQAAIDETDRRREVQRRHNEANGITPQTIVRALRAAPSGDDGPAEPRASGPERQAREQVLRLSDAELKALLDGWRKEMVEAARDLQFERAAELRDRVRAYETMAVALR
jgi:excinuclease ABC subunit B